MRIRVPGLVVACVLFAFGSVACDSTAPSSPSSTPANIEGTWNFNFSSSDSVVCPPAPGLAQGCSGVGWVELSRYGPVVTGRWMMNGGCQDCGMAWDFANNGDLEGSWVRSKLEFELNGYRFRADVPSGEVDSFTGTVSHAWGDGEIVGTWTMYRGF